MMKKIFSLISGVFTLIAAWSTIKMFIALGNKGENLEVSYAPLPIVLKNPNETIIIISGIVYIILTIGLALVTIKLAKNN